MTDSEASKQPLAKREAGGLASGTNGTDAPFELVESDGEAVDARQDWGSARRPFSPQLLLRYKWTVVGVFVVLSGASLSAIWTLIVPEYQANALIEVRSLIPRLILQTEETGPIPQYRQHLQTQVRIMQSDTVLRRVLERDDVRQTAWFQQPGPAWERLLGGSHSPLDRLNSALSVTPVRGTELIEVAMLARDPLDAKVIADGVRLQYLDYAHERFSGEDLERIDKVKQEKESIEVEIRILERKINDALEDLRTASPEQLLLQRLVRLDQLEAELGQITLDIAVAEHQLRELEPARGASSQPVSDGDARESADYAHDPEWRQLSYVLRQAEAQAEVDQDRFGPMSDRMRQHEKVIRFARRALEEREEELGELARMGLWGPASVLEPGGAASSPPPMHASAGLRSRIRLLRIRGEYLQQYVDRLRGSFDREFEQAHLLRKDKEELEQRKAWLRTVERRLRELEENRRIPLSIGTIAEAALPTRPFRDRRLKLSLAALIMSLGAGLACAYLRVAFSAQVHEAAEVKRSVRATLLGHLPLRRGHDARALEECPILAESVRVVRTTLLNRLNHVHGAVVQITSAALGSGKSTFAALLARSLAQVGKRVLLIETDGHRPSLAQRFAVDPVPGLMDLLADGASGTQGIHATAVPGLSVLPAGKPARHQDVELLANGVFSARLAQWRKQYDVILLDGAPLLVRADAAILACYVDGTIMVVREGHCRRAALMDSLAVLSAAGGKLLGAVYVGSGRGGAYGYGYESVSPPADGEATSSS